jgi:hypothetical protein
LSNRGSFEENRGSFEEGGDAEAGLSTPRRRDVDVPVEAAFSVMKPTLGRSGGAAADVTRVMQDYLNQ